MDGLSGCAALQTLTLDDLESLASVDGLSGCDALQSLEFKEPRRAPMDKLASMPDLSSLVGLKVKGLLHHEALAEIFDDEGGERGGDAVGAQRADDEQLLEGRRLLLPVAGQVLVLRVWQLDPVAPGVDTTLTG